MAHPSAGSVALDEFLADHDDIAGFAARIGVEVTSLWRYRRGKTMPPGNVTPLIEKETGGAAPAVAWSLAPSQLPALRRKLRAKVVA